LSRDPIAESGGINLNGYVGNNPANLTDPLGLARITVTKTNGEVWWAEMYLHMASHFANPWEGIGAKFGTPARIIYRHVCSDPVYRFLTETVKASNGWGAYKDGLNDAHIDISSHAALWYRWTGKDVTKDVYLIAECSDGCDM
jgi:uncharacterized protein RhaS with RHS repeats